MSANETDDAPSAADQIWSCTTGNGGVESSNNNCYNTTIDASQIVFGLAINCAIGFLCYVGFVLWRTEFRIYFNRLVSPAVPESKRPPPLELRGHRRLWSWLSPVFGLSDGTLLESAGLDALVAQRVLGFGCLTMLPLTILGVGVLVPVTYTSYTPATTTTTTTSGNTTTNSTTTINDEFLRMTMSAMPQGSKLLLVHFFFTYIFIGWVCWLIVQYYKEFISLRQEHDHRLLQSTRLDRRNSMLDETTSPGASSQIAKYLRLSVKRSSVADVNGAALSGSVAGGGGSGTLPPGDSAGRRSSVRFSDEEAAEAGHCSGGDGQAQRAALEDRGSATNGTMAQPGPPPPLAAPSGGSQPLPAAPPTAAASAASEPGSNGEAALRRKFAAVPSPSPFDQSLSGSARVGSSPVPPLDLEGQGGKGGEEGPPEWDELAEPLPLVQTADAAQFYTVLVIDAAVEEFSYSHVDSPWIWHMPRTLAGTPRVSMEALEGFVTKGKALARLTSAKHRLRLEHRHRRMEVAEQAYSELFGADFDRIVPVYNPREPDALLLRWWRVRAALDRLTMQAAAVAAARARLDGEAAEEAALDGEVAVLSAQVEELKLRRRRELDERQAAAARAEGGGAAEAGVHEQRGGSSQAEQPLAAEQLLDSGSQPQEAEQGGSAAPPPAAAQPAAGEEGAAAAPAAPPPARAGWRLCGGGGPEAAAARRGAKLAKLAARAALLDERIEAAERELADLQSEFEDAQAAATEDMPAAGFFATFRTAQAAAQAARLNLNPLHERMMRAMPAPAPNAVNYPALLRSWMSRGSRPLAVFVFVLLMILFPIGMFAGICGTVVSSFCGSNKDGQNNQSWFCSDDGFASFLRNLISSTLPSILLSVWQAVVLPLWFYTCAQAEARHFSLVALDLRCAHWFFLHDLLNVFLGGMLGGSIVWGLRAVIQEPSKFFDILGQAAPASSNFFINYVSYKALAMAPFRLFFPHMMVFGGILRWLRLLPQPKTERDREATALPINCRYSRDLGVLQLTVFVVTFAYAIVAPLILPFALVYFLLTWPVWRYQMLYVYQGLYDCQGQFWIYCAHRIVICLGVMSSFTAAVLATKGAYAQALVLFFTCLAFLWWFDTYLTLRYDSVVDQVPAVGYLLAPRARVDDRLYVPPPMRPRGAGWHPEWGKAWLGYGVPRYGL